jgi:predicted HD superfamily hydrolase involved in NAD metabolism
MDYTPIEATLGSTLSHKRFLHCCSTAQMAKEIMLRFSPDHADAAYVCGLWHDMAREWSYDALLSYCLCNNLHMEKEELAHPVLLHAPVAASLLPQNVPYATSAWCNAVRWHSLGSATMGIIGAAVFISDYIEPLRPYISAQERAQILDSPTLEAMCMHVVLRHEKHLLKKEKALANSTIGLKKFLMEGGVF